MKIVKLSSSLKSIRNTCLLNWKKELYESNLDEGRFLAQKSLVPHVCPRPKVALLHSSVTGADYAPIRL
jgi:hypothetical protein